MRELDRGTIQVQHPNLCVPNSAQPSLHSSAANSHSAWSHLQKYNLGHGLHFPKASHASLSRASSQSKVSKE